MGLIKNAFHEAALHRRLDELCVNFQTVLRWEELYLWYGVRKIAARTYRDLLSRWRTYVEELGEDPNDESWVVTVHFKRQQGTYEAILRRPVPDPQDLALLARREDL